MLPTLLLSGLGFKLHPAFFDAGLTVYTYFHPTTHLAASTQYKHDEVILFKGQFDFEKGFPNFHLATFEVFNGWDVISNASYTNVLEMVKCLR